MLDDNWQLGFVARYLARDDIMLSIVVGVVGLKFQEVVMVLGIS